MADEASVTAVVRMRDEASGKMQNFGRTTEQVTLQSLQLNVALAAMGGALNAVGSLLGQIDNPAAKVAQTFFTMGGAILSTAAAIGTMLPVIRNLILQLRNMAIAQAIVRALSGPIGIAQVVAGVAVAGAATAGIIALTGGFSGGRGGGTTINNFNDSIITTDDQGVRKLTEKLRDAGADLGRGG